MDSEIAAEALEGLKEASPMAQTVSRRNDKAFESTLLTVEYGE